MERIFVIVCKHCHNTQETLLRSGYILKKVRICKYCGKSITVGLDNLIKQIK